VSGDNSRGGRARHCRHKRRVATSRKRDICVSWDCPHEDAHLAGVGQRCQSEATQRNDRGNARLRRVCEHVAVRWMFEVPTSESGAGEVVLATRKDRRRRGKHSGAGAVLQRHGRKEEIEARRLLRRHCGMRMRQGGVCDRVDAPKSQDGVVRRARTGRRWKEGNEQQPCWRQLGGRAGRWGLHLREVAKDVLVREEGTAVSVKVRLITLRYRELSVLGL